MGLYLRKIECKEIEIHRNNVISLIFEILFEWPKIEEPNTILGLL